MSNTKELLQRARRQFPPPEGIMESLSRRRDRRRRNRRIGTAVLALSVAAVAIGGVVRAFNLAEKTQPADETQPAPLVAIPIDLGASYVAVGQGSVWVVGEDGVSRVDPATEEIVTSLQGHTPRYTGTGIAVGEGAVWAFEGVNERGGAASIVRIDPATNEVVATIQTDLVAHFDGGAGPGLWGITTGLGSVWAGSHFGGAVLRIDPATNEVEVIPVSRPVVHVGAILDGRVWVAATDADMGGCGGRDALIGIDPASGETVLINGSGLVCDEVRAGFGSLWTNPGGSIVRFDPSTQQRLATIDLGSTIGAAGIEMTIGEDAVWVALTTPDDEGLVLRIDPQTNQIVGRLHLGTPAKGIAAGEAAVWVTDGLGTLYRIDPDAVTKS